MVDFAYLPDRGVISVAGPDRVSFLNGLVSNDAARAAPGHAVWAALLTPQGRYLSDFFILADDDQLLLDVPRETIEPLLIRLKRYRLRAAVELADLSDNIPRLCRLERHAPTCAGHRPGPATARGRLPLPEHG